MITYPNAKLNLGLNVVEKRNDGFHNIETIFLPIGLSDAIEFVESEDEKVEFSNSGILVDCSAEQNLILKAYELLKADFDIPGLKVHLHKVIPFGAGLGGGSSDASFMLKSLNSVYNLGLSKEELKVYARQLGSDCAFFIDNVPCFGEGKGDELSAINVSLKGYYLVLIKPDVNVSTPAAYRYVKPVKTTKNLRDLVTLPVEQWKDKIKNDFEDSVFPQFPVIKEIKYKLYNMGATFASMSGSGASVFGIFENLPELPEELKNDGSFVWIEKF
ncbi:4-(cytidine 5'-diphospho)-2-C-methyl-D-erythritol kinase [Puteibacter caeruleilacunae]|nr:4-(cytidine 5'-diphospho)-2-C-methyl-D-erythritol kinase [Puteibacter caeruleilacunae]